MEVIEFNGKEYPAFQAEGNAKQFVEPFAKQICKGAGFDIGCGVWPLKGSIGIDSLIDDNWDAMNLPDIRVDYIFSSHCLEHIPDWVSALDYWGSKLEKGGVIFLYLPHYEQEYWRPWNNRKHINVLTADILTDYFNARGYNKIFATEGYDLNHCFTVVAEK